jgi:hypothetical protein
MGGILQVDTIQNNNTSNLITQTNVTTITIGASGQTITVPAGATLNTTTIVLAAGAVGTPSLTTSGDTNTGIFFPAADTIGFAEGGTEAMRIDSGGKVLVGTTSNTGVAGTGMNIVSGVVGDLGQATLNLAGSGGDFRAIRFASSGIHLLDITSSNPDALTIRNSSDGEIFNINISGNIIILGSTAQKASGTTWSNPSDTRLKDNKQNYTKGLNELLQINVKTWEWNGKAGTTEGTTGIGVIADEIEVLLPNTVDTYKAKLNIDDTEETDVKRFDATEITWLLLNSVKEQQAIIEQLKARLIVLENN